MGDRERAVTAAMAGGAVVAFVVLWRPWEGGARLAFFAFGTGFSAVLAGTAWWGHRLAGAFAAFLVAVFAPWGFAYLLGAPYLVLATWLGVRANRAAREAVLGTGPTLDAGDDERPRRGASGGEPGGGRSSRTSGSSTAAAGRAPSGKRSSGRGSAGRGSSGRGSAGGKRSGAGGSGRRPSGRVTPKRRGRT